MNICLALVLVSVWAGLATLFRLDTSDFPAYYTGAKMGLGGLFGSLHDPALQWSIQHPLIPDRLEPVYFPRPHVYAAILSPLGLLDMRPAYAVWVGVQIALLVAIAWWAVRRFGSDSVVLIGLFPPAILGAAFGQDPIVFLAVTVSSFILFERDRPLAAGVVLGCGMIKPHLMLLFPVALLVQKRWRMLAGFAIGGGAEAVISLLLGGWTGARTYVSFLLDKQGHLTPTPERMISIHGMMANFDSDAVVLRVALAAVVVAGCVVVWRRGEWWSGAAAAQAGTLLIAPHAFLYDSTLILLPALLTYFHARSRAARAAAALCCAPVPYLLQMFDKPYTIAPAVAIFTLLVCLAADPVELPSPAASAADTPNRG